MQINSNNYPLVSVIMNCYNGETYLADAVKSILSQTYKNFEIIFWDNQSNDNSAFIYKGFKDKRLKYYYAKKHTSLDCARNVAIKKAKGTCISFLDTDDIWLKDKLSLQIEKFKNKKINLVYSNYYILNQVTTLKKIAYKNKLPEGIIYKQLLKNYFDQKTPILTGLSATYLYRCPREHFTPEGKSFYDDIHGAPCGHFVVLCGYDDLHRRVVIADPALENPLSHDSYYKVSIHRLINAIMLGVLTYDANLLIIEPKGVECKPS